MSLKNAVAWLLCRLGFSAMGLTVLGLIFALVTGCLIVCGHFGWAAAALIASGLCDLFDGAVARLTGTDSAFGGILDSSLDRYGDAAVLGAAAIYYDRWNGTLSVLALVALAGSFAVSYVRARAECEINDCRVGFWERGERLALIALALILNNLAAALWLLAVGTHWTVFQRLAFAKHQTQGRSVEKVPFFLRTSPRNSWLYFLKISLLILVLFFLRSKN